MEVEYLFVLHVEDLLEMSIGDVLAVNIQHLFVMHMCLFGLDIEHVFVLCIEDLLEMRIEDVLGVDTQHLFVNYMYLFVLDTEQLTVVDIEDLVDTIFDLTLKTQLHVQSLTDSFAMSRCSDLTAYVHFDLKMRNEHDVVVPCCYYYC